MRRLIQLILFAGIAICSFHSYSDNNTADSLHRILRKATLADNIKTEVLLALATHYRKGLHADSTLHYATQVITRTQNKALPRYRIPALRLSANAFLMKGDYETVRSYLQKAVRLNAPGLDSISKKEVANALNLMGIVVGHFGNYDSAIHYYQRAYVIFEEQENRPEMAGELINMARMYMHMGSYPIAINFFFRSYDYIDPDDLPILFLNIGQCYVHLEEYDKAKSYSRQALSGFQQSGSSKIGETEAHATLGHLYSLTGQTDSSLHHLTRAVEMSKETENQVGIAHANYYLGVLYKKTANWTEAVKRAEEAYVRFEKLSARRMASISMLLMAEGYFQLNMPQKAFDNTRIGLDLARQVKAKNAEKDYLKLLSDLYASQSNFEEAFRFSKEYSAVKDSVFNEEKSRQIANMEALYENEKKERELALAVAEKIASEARLEKQKYKEVYLIAGLILTGALLALGSFFYHSLRKSKRIIEEQNSRLQQLNQTKDRFFAIVGHDLRGPLISFSGINNLINRYIEKNDLNQLKKLGGNISKSVSQLDTLLNNLLNWAMSQTEGIPYSPQEIQLSQLTSEICMLYNDILQDKKITLTDATDTNILVYADKNALLLVLRNLISNAIKFTHTGGEIIIETRVLNQEVSISVRDTGVGIPPEKLEKLFELSERKSTFGTANEKGTGLGLLLCKEYVQLNKGRLEIASEVKKGTIFTFTVPAYKPSEVSAVVSAYN